MTKSFAALVRETLDEIETLLIQKNITYGNSALNPVRIFSRADHVEQLNIRIDDKLSRIKRGDPEQMKDHEDTIKDLIGYLVLLKVASSENGKESSPK